MTSILENELKHPDCNCHQCTWLRANQIERAFIPKPAPEPCLGCYNPPCSKHSDKTLAVEAKIRELAKEWDRRKLYGCLIYELRELARMAGGASEEL